MIWMPDLPAAAPLVGEYPREIEADLQRVYGIDYRDRWRPGSGLTYRRLLVLLDGLPPDSLFRAAVTGRPPISRLEARIVELWEAWASKPHPVWEEKPEREQRAEALAQHREVERQRRSARDHNRRAMEARRRRMEKQ